MRADPICGGCGAVLRNGKRKWCSDRCRKRHYDLVCVDCGGRVWGTSPGQMFNRDEPVCGTCAPGHYMVWTRDAILCAIQEWADEHGGIPPSAHDWQRARARNDQRVASVTNVQRRFGTWSKAIHAAGYEPHACGPVGGYTPLTPEQRADCARRYAAGESSPQIAADLGCSPMAVIRWVRAAGVPVRAPGIPHSPQKHLNP